MAIIEMESAVKFMFFVFANEHDLIKTHNFETMEYFSLCKIYL